MGARLGQVLYWAACIVAGLLLLAVGIGLNNHADSFVLALFGTGAALIWLLGRGLKYIFAGQ